MPNRGIFAINELPDLAGKIQVGLFNILQEGDVQIKGYPVRLPLDVMMVFSANPEDYTARGKIITPLKDRIGSEIRTHYPVTRHAGMSITTQEAWTSRSGHLDLHIADFVREIVEEVAFQARQDSRVDKRSGVSQRLPISLLENVISNAERRALLAREAVVAPRVTDIYAALPAITGKFELEYEGELRGADAVAREIIRSAVGTVFTGDLRRRGLRPRRSSGSSWAARSRWTTRSVQRSCSNGPRRSRACMTWRGRQASPRAPRRRFWPRQSISCSRGSTRRRRSAGRTIGSITASSRHDARSARRRPTRASSASCR